MSFIHEATGERVRVAFFGRGLSVPNRNFHRNLDLPRATEVNSPELQVKLRECFAVAGASPYSRGMTACEVVAGVAGRKAA